jgi:single-stranded DNA-binding protein
MTKPDAEPRGQVTTAESERSCRRPPLVKQKESLNGKNWELKPWIRVTWWRNLAEAANQYLEKDSQVFVEGELRGEASDGSQNPRIWQGNDGDHRVSYEVTASTVKFPAQQHWAASREGNGGALTGGPPPCGDDDNLLPSRRLPVTYNWIRSATGHCRPRKKPSRRETRSSTSLQGVCQQRGRRAQFFDPRTALQPSDPPTSESRRYREHHCERHAHQSREPAHQAAG